MTGVELIAAERERQVTGEGYDADHDAGHQDELALAAAVYALPHDERRIAGAGPITGIDLTVDLVATLWPWDPRFWKPLRGDRVRELVKAGALIAAAIDAEIAERAG